MPNWYWEKKDLRTTPSQEKGLDFNTEARYRREGVRFIMELGRALNLSHNTMATGAVYYHRFYMFHAFQEFPKFPVATTCLFLAGKAEETPKKCRDIIRTAQSLTNERQFKTFGADPREEVMALERVLLQTIHFDLQADHPYTFIIKYAKSLKGDKNKLQKMVQMSWTFVNDSLCTTLCLQWEPEIIAVAVMYLAIKLSKFEVKDWNNRLPHHANWWDQFVEDLEGSDLEEICHQVLDLYMQPTQPAKDAAASPPPVQKLAKPHPSKAKTPQPKATSVRSKVPQKTANPSTPTKPPTRTGPKTPPQKSRPTTPPPPPSTAQASKPPPPPTAAPVLTAAPAVPPMAAVHAPAYGLPPAAPLPVPYTYPPNFTPVAAPPYPPGYGYPPPPSQTFFPSAPPPTTYSHPPPPPPRY